MYCCDWDEITPDFIFIGKTLAAGYSSLSAVLTNKEFENVIKNGQVTNSTHKYTSRPLNWCFCCKAVQEIINNTIFLKM